MKRIFVLLLVISLTLTGCININLTVDNSEPTVPAAQEPTQEDETTVEVLDYPDGIGTEDEKLLTPLLSDELFNSTGEENGKVGTMYQIYGTVDKYIFDEAGNIEALHLTTHKGDIAIGDPCQMFMEDNSMDELGSVDLEKLRRFFPLPAEGEFVRIFAEYQGMSNKYGCPYFIYGDTGYLTNALMESMGFN